MLCLLFNQRKLKQIKADWRRLLVVLINFLHSYAMLNINSGWDTEAPKHNRYIDWPSVDFAYCVTITCNKSILPHFTFIKPLILLKWIWHPCISSYISYPNHCCYICFCSGDLKESQIKLLHSSWNIYKMNLHVST